MVIGVNPCLYAADYDRFFVLVKGKRLKNCSFEGSSLGGAGDRLREERTRLDLKQEDLATAGGVNRNTQGSYERGQRSPDAAYLLAVSALGVDVLYVVIGARTLPPVEDLDDTEEQLIRRYRGLTTSDKQAVVRIVGAMSEVKAGTAKHLV